ncbi:MAG TPA: HAD family hydrolase [Leptospiraceae bacterium]|nr:HAD family hydrolase [Leptospiraceae bacterium]HMX31665.1 HAD family hydrolase [Leptospiraceae bacterium]HMY30451.1 HAD family hydrolase [Leptospiraceae bacterium]HMZ67048.1 HAD family hydrolase [Leptospiraceae bacterium]HNA06458.1 HAD family hydrolase [Leptospiraceae bacterium]
MSLSKKTILNTVKLLAFDVDGTLFSSEEIILDTYIEAIQRFIQKHNKKIPIPTKEKIIEQIGLPVKKIFLNLLPELEEIERDEISDSVLILLREKIQEKKGKIYEGVEDTIKELHKKGYVLCVASNGRIGYIEAILQTYHLMSYFEAIVVIDYEKIKSKGDIVASYLQHYNLKGENSLMIGDRKSDLDAALDNGSHFAYCEYGHAEPNEIQQFSIQIKSIRELLDYL